MMATRKCCFCEKQVTTSITEEEMTLLGINELCCNQGDCLHRAIINDPASSGIERHNARVLLRLVDGFLLGEPVAECEKEQC
jgi:hypothetical protein